MTTITAGAVIPVSGPHNTTPAYSGTFIPTIWSGKLNVKFYAATTFGDISNTNWQGEISGLGDKVIINNVPTITISEYTVGMNLSYEVPTPNVIELVIDKAFYFGVGVNDVLEYQAKPELMGMFTDDASNQMKIKVDTECFLNTFTDAAAANIGTSAGLVSDFNLGSDAAPITLAANNILATITAMSTILDEQNVPETDRWLVITPAERNLLMQSNLAQAQFMGDSQSILRNGRIGQIDRFTVYVSNLLPKAAADQNYTGGTDSGKVKRHIMMAGHKSALTFAGQINKMENLPNPSDFGKLVRGLMVYGRKVAKPEALTYAVCAG